MEPLVILKIFLNFDKFFKAYDSYKNSSYKKE